MYQIKRYLLLGRKAMTNLDSTFKSRDNNLLTKVHIVKALVFCFCFSPLASCGSSSGPGRFRIKTLVMAVSKDRD